MPHVLRLSVPDEQLQRWSVAAAKPAPAQRDSSGWYERQWITAAFTLIFVVGLPHENARRKACGKTRTHKRVDAAVIHYLKVVSLGVTTSARGRAWGLSRGRVRAGSCVRGHRDALPLCARAHVSH